MAKVLKSYEWKAVAARQGKYPWDEWLDGQIRQMDAEDFAGGSMPKAFPAVVRKQAKKRNLLVKVQKTEDGGVVIQAFKPEGEQGADGAEGKVATGKGKGKK